MTSSTSFGIDKDLKQNYVDQFTAGMERELFADFAVQAQYIRRNFRGFMAFSDTASIYQAVQRQDPGQDNVLGTADDGTFLTVYNLTNPGRAFLLLTNPSGAYRNYNGFQIVVRKRESRGWARSRPHTRTRRRRAASGTNRARI